MPLYPLRFEPIFKSVEWGGRRLPELVKRPAPDDKPIGEAWVLSDVDGSVSVVADGPLAGTPLRALLAADPAAVLGGAAAPLGRFPLLLKFIDARRELSVQVHPNDEQAPVTHPGCGGKTEAWVVLDADPATSRLYSGLRRGVTRESFEAALAAKTVPDVLHAFTPRRGDCVFIEAGTVHAIGADVLVFEVQQTSDITFRLYDWGRDRPMHIADGLRCANFAAGPCEPRRGHGPLVECPYFSLHRWVLAEPFRVGKKSECRAVVCVGGGGDLEWGGKLFPMERGDTYLLPADVGGCEVLPRGEITVLECGVP